MRGKTGFSMPWAALLGAVASASLAASFACARSPGTEATFDAAIREQTGFTLAEALGAATGRDPRLTARFVSYSLKRTDKPLLADLSAELKAERGDCERSYGLRRELQSCLDGLKPLQQDLVWIGQARRPEADARLKVRLAARIYQQQILKEVLDKNFGPMSKSRPEVRSKARLVFAVAAMISELAALERSEAAQASKEEHAARELLAQLGPDVGDGNRLPARARSQGAEP